MSHAAEALAVALYESDCREQAGDMARRTTLSRVRAFYSFPSYANLTGRERNFWRREAARLVAESTAELQAATEWEQA